MQKVRNISVSEPDPHAASLVIDGELWHYLCERASVIRELQLALHPGSASSLKSAATPPPPRRISLRNLAEYLLRLWAPPRSTPKPRAST